MKINLKSLALCAAMLSFGFGDNVNLFGGNLGGRVYQDLDNNGLFQSFGSQYNSNEFSAKAAQYALPVNLGIIITNIQSENLFEGPRITNYEADVHLGGISEGKIYLSARDPNFMSICFENVNLNGINHNLMIKLSEKDKYYIEIHNYEGAFESRETLAAALRHIGLNLPLLCKGLLKLRDNWTEFKNRAENVGSFFTL